MDDRPLIYIDTQIVTTFKFLDEPDSFIADGVEEARFVITTPVIAELERIKDEHFSKGQRDRARKCLATLETAEYAKPVNLSAKSELYYHWPEPSSGAVSGMGMNVHEPDGRLVAAILERTRSSNLHFYVLSDDLGVRVRCQHSSKLCTVYKPKDGLRYAPEEFNLSQLVKASVRELARALADELRNGLDQG